MGMKKPITIVSSISIFLFVIALVWLVAGIYIDKKNGNANADARYEKLLEETKQNFSLHGYGTSEFSNNFIHAIGDIDDFSSLKLEINGELVYSYPPSVFSLPSPELIKSYADTISISDQTFTLKASVYLMSPNSIYTHSRFAFLLILVGTLITGVVILLMGNNESPSDYPFSRSSFHSKKEKKVIFNPEPEEIAEDSDDAEDEDTIPPLSSEDQSESQIKSEEITIQFPESQPILSEKDEEEWKDEDLFINQDENEKDEEEDGGLDIIDQFEQQNQDFADDDIFADFNEEEEKPEEEKEELPAKPKEEDISPITQIKLQSALEETLNGSIGKEKSQATLALFKINGLDRGNSISKTIISMLKEKVSDSMIFEYKSDAYALFFENLDLQNTVSLAEDLYAKISDYLKNNNAVNEVSVGISSVCERQLNGDRLILEADQALNYASQDPDSPIVAFRANPEKYKAYQESQQA